MIINSRRFKLIACLGLFAATVTSCRKHYDEPETSNDTQLIVSFSSVGVPINKTDSVAVIFTNSTDTIHKAGLRGGTFYSVPLKGLKEGIWQADTKVYGAADSNGVKRMYRIVTSVNTTTGASLTSPLGKLNDSWRACIFMYNADYNIRFAMSEYPGDNFYELYLPNTITYKNVYIDRHAYRKIDSNTRSLIQAAYTILKVADSRGHRSNQTAFEPFSAVIRKQQYDYADFSLQLFNEANNDYKIVFQKEVAYRP